MSEQGSLAGQARPLACTACGAPGPKEARFCSACGASLPAAVADAPVSAEASWLVPPRPQPSAPRPELHHLLPTVPSYLLARPRSAQRWLLAGGIAVAVLLIAAIALLTNVTAEDTLIGTWREEGTARLLPGTSLTFSEDGFIYLNETQFASYEIVDDRRLALKHEGEIVEAEYDLLGDRLLLTVEGEVLRLRRAQE